MDREELTDLISDAISDSMDVDWNYSSGARYVVDALINEGIVKLTPPAENDLSGRQGNTSVAHAPRDTPEPSSPPEDELSKLSGGWEPIETAPKDGSSILAWTVHANAKYSKDPVGEGWACISLTRWIDHNGGGWTWHGLCGEHVLWQPLPALPQDHAPVRGEDHG